ncbi:MAG: tetratricopeptide repeat protein [Cryobacterium sp.]|nr:tetratricopeptide repeat protein [Cryobacterium sp.]
MTEPMPDSPRERARILEEARTFDRHASEAHKSGKLQIAETKYKLALNLYRQAGYTEREQANCHRDLGNVYRDAGRLKKAEQSQKRALNMFEQLEGTERDQADCHQNLGDVYRGAGRLKKAEQSHKQALTMYQQLEGTERQQAACHQNLGDVYRDAGRLEEAEAEYMQARSTLQTLGLSHELPRVDLSLAQLRQTQAEQSTDPTLRSRLLEEALGFAVPAMLQMDAARLQFPTEQKRLKWSTEVAGPYIRKAFELAELVGDTTLVSDLIAHSRAAGIIELVTNDDPDAVSGLGVSAAEIFLTASVDPDGADGTGRAGSEGDPEPNSGPTPEDPPSQSASAHTLGVDMLLKRKPVPTLKMPNGRFALEQYRPQQLTTIKYV